MVIKYLKSLKKNKEKIINILIIIIIVSFLFNFLKPEFIFSKTTTSGGDMASHYYTAYYMKNYLLPHGKISGWTPGNYAGFPILNFYFPLPFVLMALLTYVIPLEISFKLVTILGILSLPITTFFFFRLMKFKFPTPIIASMSSLFFLFIESYSMWGGNIPSTLAGEFTYSIGLSLSVLFFGTLYKGVTEKKYLILNPILLALIGLNHVYTLLFAGFSSFFFFLAKKNFKENLKYLSKIYILSFLLISFWLFPLFSKLNYTTSYILRWHINIWDLFPKILIPSIILTVISLLFLINKNIRKDRRIYYIFFPILVSLFFYFIATKLEVVDTRFIPFIHLSIIFTGTFALDRLIKKLKLKWIIPIIFLIITILWVNYNETFIDSWIKWNYEGFENKQPWPTYDKINQFLKGGFNDPRVIYEHSQEHDQFGTPRAFESLPLFANRATLEGVYMQSSLSAPAIFYIQSEMSKERSCPFPNYECTLLNINNGAKHMEMFNVKHFIVISDEVKKALNNNSKFKLLKKFDNYEIYELITNKNRYIEIPEYEPVVFETNDWKNISYEWFKRQDLLDIPLIFTKNTENFKYKTDNLDKIPKISLDTPCNIKEQIKEEEILFETNCLNKPHIIKVSYFPNWKVQGADKIYLVSPSFMLVYPKENNVKIYYGKTGIDIAGIILTISGLIIVLLNKKWKK